MSLSPAGVINGASFKDERCCLASQMAHFEFPPLHHRFAARSEKVSNAQAYYVTLISI